jgi:hypothetical protein
MVIVREYIKMHAPTAVLVRCLCLLFQSVLDLENFPLVLQQCGEEVRLEMIHRMGILNVWNPLHPGTMRSKCVLGLDDMLMDSEIVVCGSRYLLYAPLCIVHNAPA